MIRFPWWWSLLRWAWKTAVALACGMLFMRLTGLGPNAGFLLSAGVFFLLLILFQGEDV